MKNYTLILCYNKNDQASFLRTKVFKAKDDAEGYSVGEEILEKEHPEELKDGYNSWLLNVDDLGREIHRAKFEKFFTSPARTDK